MLKLYQFSSPNVNTSITNFGSKINQAQINGEGDTAEVFYYFAFQNRELNNWRNLALHIDDVLYLCRVQQGPLGAQPQSLSTPQTNKQRSQFSKKGVIVMQKTWKDMRAYLWGSLGTIRYALKGPVLPTSLA